MRDDNAAALWYIVLSCSVFIAHASLPANLGSTIYVSEDPAPSFSIKSVENATAPIVYDSKQDPHSNPVLPLLLFNFDGGDHHHTRPLNPNPKSTQAESNQCHHYV